MNGDGERHLPTADVIDLEMGKWDLTPCPPLHKWRGGIDARKAGVYDMRWGMGPHPRSVGHPFSMNGEGELTPAKRAYVWQGGKLPRFRTFSHLEVSW